MRLFGYEVRADNGNFGGVGFASIADAIAEAREFAIPFARGAVSVCVYMVNPDTVRRF